VQRSQNGASAAAGVPDQVPGVTVQVDPTAAEPVTVGAVVLAGATGPSVATVVRAPPSANPAVLVAATWAVRYFPASAFVDTYVVLRAPEIAVHPAGTEVQAAGRGLLQRNQKGASDGAGVPDQVPVETIQVDPTAGEPVTVGATVSAGAIGPSVVTVVSAPARAKPAELLAAT
jgi:hypothetical protein